jgi:hypothetical protein
MSVSKMEAKWFQDRIDIVERRAQINLLQGDLARQDRDKSQTREGRLREEVDAVHVLIREYLGPADFGYGDLYTRVQLLMQRLPEKKG